MYEYQNFYKQKFQLSKSWTALDMGTRLLSRSPAKTLISRKLLTEFLQHLERTCMYITAPVRQTFSSKGVTGVEIS